MKTINERLRYLLKAIGKTPGSLASELGVSRSSIQYSLTTGKDTRLSTVLKIVQYFISIGKPINLYWLFFGFETPFTNEEHLPSSILELHEESTELFAQKVFDLLETKDAEIASLHKLVGELTTHKTSGIEKDKIIENLLTLIKKDRG